MTKIKRCENCKALMTYNTEYKKWLCELCGNVESEESEEKEISYVG